MWLNGWSNSKKFVAPETQIDANFPYFPMPVYLNEDNFDFSKAKADGSDIRFTDKNLNLLKFERKEHSNALQMAVYNVLIPTVSDLTDTEFYMWYGNPSAYNDSIESWQDKTGKQITYNGNVKLVPNVAKFGKAGYFDSSCYVSITDSDDFYFGSGDFTIDFWFRRATIDNRLQYMCAQYGGSGTPQVDVFIDSNNLIKFGAWNSSTGSTVVGMAITDTNLHHVEAVKSSSVLKLFVDGIQTGGDVANNITLDNIAQPFNLGYALNQFGMLFNGYIDEFRISKGIARHTANFSVPTEPYTADQYTKLLMHFDDFDAMRIATSTTGTDYLYFNKAVTLNTTKTFAIEFKMKVESGSAMPVQGVWVANGAKNLEVYFSPTSIKLNPNGTSPTTVAFDTTTEHIYTLEFQGTTQGVLKADGNIIATAPYANLIAGGGTIGIGDGFTSANQGGSVLWKYWKYNLDLAGTPDAWVEWNYNKGLPTDNGWAANGTASLATLVFKDETGKAVYTYGDVKPIKTAYADGARSAYFDGSGDYFTTTGVKEVTTGTSSFTLESKVSFSTLPANGYGSFIYSKYTSAPSTWYLSLQNSGGTYYLYAYFYNSGVTVQIPWTPILNRMYDIAFLKDGSDYKIFVDGVQVGTTVTNSANIAYINDIQTSYIGFYGTSYYHNGHIAGLRITQDTARYSAAYNPPSKFEIDSDKVVFNTMFDTIYDQNYAMVQHMGDSLVDATGNGNNGTATGTTVVNTEFGKARSFNGTTSNYISCGSGASLQTPTFTDIVLTKPTNVGNNETLIGGADGSPHFNISDASNKLQLVKQGVAVVNTGGSPITYGEYSVFSVNYHSDGVSKTFIDGAVDNSVTSAQTFTYGETRIGQKISGTDTVGAKEVYSGEIVEVRRENIARSDAWIKAESLALKNTLLTISEYNANGNLFFGMNF